MVHVVGLVSRVCSHLETLGLQLKIVFSKKFPPAWWVLHLQLIFAIRFRAFMQMWNIKVGQERFSFITTDKMRQSIARIPSRIGREQKLLRDWFSV